jgi:amino acid transporter
VSLTGVGLAKPHELYVRNKGNEEMKLAYCLLILLGLSSSIASASMGNALTGLAYFGTIILYVVAILFLISDIMIAYFWHLRTKGKTHKNLYILPTINCVVCIGAFNFGIWDLLSKPVPNNPLWWVCLFVTISFHVTWFLPFSIFITNYFKENDSNQKTFKDTPDDLRLV